jgi:hypothetical protein
MQASPHTSFVRFPGHWLRLCFLSALLVLASFAPGSDHDAEYKLKAAFLYNFTQYMTWEGGGNEIIIGVLGNSPVYDQLLEVAKAKSGGDKKITVKQFDNVAEATYCNIMFIPQNYSGSLDDVLAKMPKGTLTVTEKPGLGARGAAINFIIVNNKLKFESNIKALNASGIKVSSQLLKLAIIVGS